MIEINLVPDVKQELIRAQRQRAAVISIAIIAGLASLAVVVLLVLWVFGVQAARGAISDNTIRNESAKLANVPDISNALTIQNQLSQLSTMHDNKPIDSRIFDVLTTINPPAPNDVKINNLTLDSSTNTITIQAQAVNLYVALDVFKKTINSTHFTYTEDGDQQSVPLASNMSDYDRSYGQDDQGTTVLRFTLSFTYPPELFSRSVKNAVIEAPTKHNATDSYLAVPKSLFTQRANDLEGGN